MSEKDRELAALRAAYAKQKAAALATVDVILSAELLVNALDADAKAGRGDRAAGAAAMLELERAQERAHEAASRRDVAAAELEAAEAAG